VSEDGGRWLPALVLGLVAVTYLPSLGGGWVWDDVYQLRDNPAITQPRVLASHDVWGPTGFADPRNTPVYRPLAMLSHVPGQALWRGPAVERLLSLALHLGALALVAGLALALGLDRRAAWFGAACFGLHPAATEAVAWASARADLLGVVLLAGAMAALARGRPWLAGGLAGLAPFCKEPFVLAPLCLAIWMLGLRRRDPPALLLPWLGVAAYFAARHAFGIASPGAGPATQPGAVLGALGAVAGRGLVLFANPLAPDALPPVVPNLLVGSLALTAALVGLAAVPGRPWLAALLAPLPLLLPAALASLGNGYVSDRYFLPALLGTALAAASGYAALARRRAWAPALFALPLLWAPCAAWRAAQWTDNETLFRAALARHPDSAEARFHLAYALHVEKGDCAAALPLYDRAAGESLRAGNNLQACLLELGRLAEAAEIGPGLAERDPLNPTPAVNTARALSLLGDQGGAERWAREALRRDARRTSAWVLLGNVLGLQERYAESARAFEAALDVEPGLAAARRGRSLALRRLAGEAPRDS
jgi:tetratricopeptide (TPR) repeat protein